MIWILWSCTTVPVDEATPPEKGAYLVAAEMSTPPAVSQVEYILQLAIDKIRFHSARPFVNRYLSLMSLADSQCPTWYTGQDGPYWFDNCISDSGALFEGYGTHQSLVDQVDEAGNIWNGTVVYSEAWLEAESGEWISSTGNATFLTGTNGSNGADLFYSYLSSNYADVALERAPYVNMWASSLNNYRGIFFDAVMNIEGDTVVFNENQLTSESSCPTGSQSVLTESGWVQLSWNPTECTGCSTVFFEGRAIGEVCLDFSSWMDWADNPWDLEDLQE